MGYCHSRMRDSKYNLGSIKCYREFDRSLKGFFMANERLDQLPTTTAAQLSDLCYAVQGFTSPTNLGTSVQETWQQVLSLITAGSNISVAFNAGSLVISATGLPGIGWTHVTTTSVTLAANNGYVLDNAGLVTALLPATAAFGSVIYIQGFGGGGWSIAQNTGQSIHVGAVASSTGTGGSISSTNQYDSLTLLCVVADTTFTVLGAPQGNITIV